MTKEQQDAVDRLTTALRSRVWYANLMPVRTEDLDTVLKLLARYTKFDPRLPRDGADLLADLCGEKGRVL